MNNSTIKTKLLKSNIKGIIFDMDGVIIESEELHAEIEQKLLKGFGVNITKEELKEFVGKRFIDEFRILKKRYKLKVSLKDFFQKHELIVRRYYEKIFPASPGIKSVIKKLSKNYKLALATSSNRYYADSVIKRLKLTNYLRVTVCAEDVIKGKPHPEPFLKAARKLKIEPENIVVVEDAINGFIAAKKAGMLVIARKNNHNIDQDFSKADSVLTDFKQLPALITRLAK